MSHKTFIPSICVWTFIFLPFNGGIHAQVVLDSVVTDSIVISSGVHLFWDESGKMTFEEVIDQKDELLWEKLGPELPRRSGPGKTWVRFSIVNTSTDSIYALIKCYRLRRVMHQWIDAYIQGANGVEIQRTGRFRNYQDRAFPPCRDCLRLEIAAQETQTYWVKLTYAYVHEPDMGFLIIPESFAKAQVEQELPTVLPTYLFSFFFLGIVFVLMVFAGIQYLENREKAYLWYFLYLAGWLVFNLRSIESQSHLDILYTYVLDTYYVIYVPLLFFVYYAYLMFMEHFLHLSKYDKYHKKILKYLPYILIATCVIDAFIRVIWGTKASMAALDLYQILMLGLVIYYLISAIRMNNRIAYFVILGSFFVMVGAIINGIIIGLFDGYFISSQSLWYSASTYLRLGILLEILCFMLGLSYKTQQSIREKQEEKLKIEQQLMLTQHRQDLEKEKNRLYINITHEFRTPLTVITGIAQQIRENPTRWLGEGLVMIKRNAASLLNLINQILDLRKLETGNMNLHLIQANIIPYIHYLTESFSSLAASKNIQIRFQSKTEELWMDYEPNKIQHIVSNLLSNAIKFTPEGGDISVQLAVDSLKSVVGGDHSTTNSQLPVELSEIPQSEKNCLLLTIIDTGIGIPVENIPHIFDRFYQVEHSNPSNSSSGSGIGLALTKELVKLLNGNIFVNSVEGVGSTFIVELPITRKAEISHVSTEFEKQIDFSISSQSKAITFDKEAKERPIVLVIEDNKDVVRYIYSILQADYHLEVAENGKKGIDKALEIIPDIIISDVMMPKKDGFEVCRTLKIDERSSHIPIVLLTARADIDAKLKGLEYGADAYLAKPFNKAELLVRIRKLLESREKLKQYYLNLASEGKSDLRNSPQQKAPVENTFVLKARQIVESNLANTAFNVDDFCQKIGMSHSQLHRKLVALTGYSTNKFIRFIRLSHAKKLLKQEDIIIADVAFATGFADPAYFARVFRKEFGVTPRVYREQNI